MIPRRHVQDSVRTILGLANSGLTVPRIGRYAPYEVPLEKRQSMGFVSGELGQIKTLRTVPSRSLSNPEGLSLAAHR